MKRFNQDRDSGRRDSRPGGRRSERPQCFRRNPTVHVEYGYGNTNNNNSRLGPLL